ncbi:MAG TPA: UxaA family hydrolase [Verrucomicrobiae bacterium]
MIPRAFQISAADNVATLIDEAAPGKIGIIGASQQELTVHESIGRGHKLALQAIASGAPVIKYGVQIGHATREIRPGDWVHLHNLASDLDERSGTLDLHTGAPSDTQSAYA